jgi:hypothetical protein
MKALCIAGWPGCRELTRQQRFMEKPGAFIYVYTIESRAVGAALGHQSAMTGPPVLSLLLALTALAIPCWGCKAGATISAGANCTVAVDEHVESHYSIFDNISFEHMFSFGGGAATALAVTGLSWIVWTYILKPRSLKRRNKKNIRAARLERMDQMLSTCSGLEAKKLYSLES